MYLNHRLSLSPCTESVTLTVNNHRNTQWIHPDGIVGRTRDRQMDGVTIWIVRIFNKRETERKINSKKKRKKGRKQRNMEKEWQERKKNKERKTKKERKKEKGEDKDCMIMRWPLTPSNDVDFWVHLYVTYCFDLSDISIRTDFHESFYNICVDAILFAYHFPPDDGTFLFLIYNNVISETTIRVRLT